MDGLECIECNANTEIVKNKKISITAKNEIHYLVYKY
jgi:hypothetical protein